MNCPKCDGPMWDNRETKTNPKQPDFKCKDKENCDGVIWPPSGSARRTAPSAARPTAQQRNNGGDPDRSSRIERQHSQEMALRYIAIKEAGGEESVSHDTKLLRGLIDWFQRDIGHIPTTVAQAVTEDAGQDEEPF